MELNGVGAIVTGGASGLGEAASGVWRAAGANVVIADVNEERGKEIVAELGGGTEFVRTDVDERRRGRGGRCGSRRAGDRCGSR